MAITLMLARIQVEGDLHIDPRAVPIALVGLFEGGPSALAAAALAALFRGSRGGSGMWAGITSLLAGALVAGLVHAWARRQGGVRPVHAFSLAGVTFATTFLGFLVLGGRGLALFGRTWPYLLVAHLVGIGVLARFLHEVAERARLDAAHRRFRALIDDASDAIRIVDRDSGRIVEANRMDCELTGYAREELVGRDVRELWPEEAEGQQAWAALHAAASGGEAVRAFALPCRTRTGQPRRIDATRRLVRHGGRPYEITIYRDAAERLAAEAAQQEVAELRAVTLLARGAAHEINNPLTLVLGALQLLERRPPGETERAGLVRRALEGAERIRDIVARMNRITRVAPAKTRTGLPDILDFEKSSDPD